MPGLLLLGARARCGSRKNGKEDRSQIGTFRSSRSRGAQTCSGAMEGNQAWTGGRLALFLMGSSNRLIGRAANAGVVGEKVGGCRLREASGRLAAWAGEVRLDLPGSCCQSARRPSRPWAAPVRWWACRWHRPILLIAAHGWPTRGSPGPGKLRIKMQLKVFDWKRTLFQPAAWMTASQWRHEADGWQTSFGTQKNAELTSIAANSQTSDQPSRHYLIWHLVAAERQSTEIDQCRWLYRMIRESAKTREAESNSVQIISHQTTTKIVVELCWASASGEQG